MKTIKMNSQDLGLVGTIDTYQTYKGDSSDDYLIGVYNEEHGTDYGYDDFEWEYDLEQIVKDLAEVRAKRLEEDNSAVSCVKVVKTGSPQFYNYGTDWAIFEITYDDKKVEDYIEEHADDYKQWRVQANWAYNIDWREEGDKKKELEEMAKLSYFLNKTTYDYDEGWYYALAEDETGIYVENTKMGLKN